VAAVHCNQSCTEAIAQDVLEHLPRAKASTALREWNRILALGGLLTLRLPSLERLLALFQERRTVPEHQTLIQCLYGTQGYRGDFHLNGFTELTLRYELDQAGFQVDNIDVVDGWLFDVRASKARHTEPDLLLARGDPDQAFIEAAYLALFHRPADVEGMRYFLEVLDSGIDRETVLTILRSSPEFKG
jgi:predicted SAM-dependent methyltransferase